MLPQNRPPPVASEAAGRTPASARLWTQPRYVHYKLWLIKCQSGWSSKYDYTRLLSWACVACHRNAGDARDQVSGHSARSLLRSSVLWHPLLSEGPFSFSAVPACMNPCKVAAGLGGQIRGRFRNGPQREGLEGRDDKWSVIY